MKDLSKKLEQLREKSQQDIKAMKDHFENLKRTNDFEQASRNILAAQKQANLQLVEETKKSEQRQLQVVRELNENIDNTNDRIIRLDEVQRENQQNIIENFQNPSIDREEQL